MKGDLCQRLTFEHYRRQIEAFLRPEPWPMRAILGVLRLWHRLCRPRMAG
jgi:hypothetical protein